MMEKLAVYKKSVPQIDIGQDVRGKWRYKFGFMCTDEDGKEYYDCLLPSSDAYETAEEAEAVARFVICNAWTVTETVDRG